MSILNLSSRCTSSAAAGFRVIALAKKGQWKQQKSLSTPKKGTPSPREGEGTVPDTVPEERTTTRTTLGSTYGASDQKDGAEGTKSVVFVAADRGAILKACIGTSAGLSVSGLLLRQLSHWGAEGGWHIPDCTTLMPYKTELWHVIPTVGVVVLVSSLRQILLRVWPDFAQSSEVANNQVLRSVKTVDIFTVSSLSGISEELLFRGALLPFLGPDWKGVLGAGLIFGALHISGGRNASFAIWASFVGVVYGILGLYTSDLATPMAAHSAANLLGAAIWKVQSFWEDSGSVQVSLTVRVYYQHGKYQSARGHPLPRLFSFTVKIRDEIAQD